MARPITLCSIQWTDLPFEMVCHKAKAAGYDGLELACWGDHFDVTRAIKERSYCERRRETLAHHGMMTWAISNHYVGQAVCDRIDSRHRSILPAHVWGDGKPESVNKRAAEEMMKTAHAAKNLGVKVVNGFTGSSIWHLIYGFPPVSQSLIDDGFAEFAKRWHPILDEFKRAGVKFALEVHPTEIAFDIVTAERALAAIGNRKEFGFNYDPSHFGYQGVDYVEFLRFFSDRIYHVHMKDVYYSPRPRRSGIFGSHLNEGDPKRYWEFRLVGRGSLLFEPIIRALNEIGYEGPLSVEWEDVGMEREQAAAEGFQFVKNLDFRPGPRLPAPVFNGQSKAKKK
jgi:sugar phosphate isomerase/epimerase